MVKRNPWLTLTVLAVAQFVVVLDLTIVNVALPHIQSDLHFSTSGLQWIVSAYTLMFGGFLLLGGRAADLFGRRRLFMAGLALFTIASLSAGVAQSSGMMIAARAVQGLGGAMLSPAALSLVTVTFPHGRDRNVALGIWSALAGIGGTLGVVVGGILIQAIGWRAVFFVNVPIGIALIAIAPLLISESRVTAANGSRRMDLPGAFLGTGGLLALVFGIVRTQALGWGSVEVIISLAAGLVLLTAFVIAEARTNEPLLPLRIFKPPSMRTGSLALSLNGATFLGMFFLLTIFLQQVRHESALQTGLELLPMGVMAVAGAVLASTLITEIGTRPVQTYGAALSVVGLYLLSHAGATDAYVSSVLPGTLLFGLGLSSVGVPSQIAATSEVRPDDAGAASGVINATFQIGGALGLAIITTISNSHVTDLLHSGVSATAALTGGFQRGLLIAAVLAAVNLLVAIGSPRILPTAEMVAGAAGA